MMRWGQQCIRCGTLGTATNRLRAVCYECDDSKVLLDRNEELSKAFEKADHLFRSNKQKIEKLQIEVMHLRAENERLDNTVMAETEMASLCHEETQRPCPNCLAKDNQIQALQDDLESSRLIDRVILDKRIALLNLCEELKAIAGEAK